MLKNMTLLNEEEVPFNKPILGDALDVTRKLPGETFQCCVTSPSYWGQRDYDVDGQIGLEETPEIYVEKIRAVFHEVKRALVNTGTLWFVIDDSYSGNASQGDNRGLSKNGKRDDCTRRKVWKRPAIQGVHAKNLAGIPYLIESAFRNDGWIVRQRIIWYKRNARPEPTKDRCTHCYEYIYLFSKTPSYYFDYKAIKEKLLYPEARGISFGGNKYPKKMPGSIYTGKMYDATLISGRNCRDVWDIPVQPHKGPHTAVFPDRLAKRCIAAGSRKGDIVLDPFLGSGTVGRCAQAMDRRWIGIELNEEYYDYATHATRYKQESLDFKEN